MPVLFTKGALKLPVELDVQDYDLLKDYKWYAHKGRKTYYARGVVNGRRVYMHRVIMGEPANVFVDHKDGNGLCNVRSNLRLASDSENQCNREKTIQNSTGYKGVHKAVRLKNKPYEAQIRVNNRRYHLGRYATAEEAAQAYATAAQKLHAEYANTGALNGPRN